MTGGTPTTNDVSLALSLLFGVAQLAVGAGVASRLLRRDVWRRRRDLLLVLLGLWFAASGVTELFVSGMEVARQLRGVPSAMAFDLWRGRADGFLLVVSAALVVCLLMALVADMATRAKASRQ
jgi:hypothetical protein